MNYFIETIVLTLFILQDGSTMKNAEGYKFMKSKPNGQRGKNQAEGNNSFRNGGKDVKPWMGLQDDSANFTGDNGMRRKKSGHVKQY